MEIKNRKILLCSLLKPADDVRQYRKLAITLASLPHTEVISVGSKANTKVPEQQNIWLISAFTYQRWLFFRILNIFKMFKILLQLKPEVIIVSSSDLLLVTTLYKILFGCKLCYDVQENYYLNLWYSKSWSAFLRYPLALLVSTIEWLCSPFISQYFLAEALYARQLPYLSPTRTLILENTFQPYHSWETDKATIKKQENLYLISGTLGPAYLILESIAWFLAQIVPNTPKAKLLIAGYAPDGKYLEQIEAAIKGIANISLVGGKELVPYQDLIRLQLSAQYGIINLANNAAMEGKVATKLYEYIANDLIIIDLGFSNSITKTNLVISFSKNYLWEANAKLLLRLFSNLLSSL